MKSEGEFVPGCARHGFPFFYLVHLSTAATQKRSAPPWVKFGSAQWVNFRSAPTANDNIANIVADNILSRLEKSQLVTDWQSIYNERDGIIVAAQQLGLSTANYTNNYNALAAYLNGLSPAWNDVSQDTIIDPNAYRGNFINYNYERQMLLNATAAAAATRANWAQINSKPADSAILNSNVKVGLNLAPTPRQWTAAGHIFYGTGGPAWNTADTRSLNGEFFNMSGQDGVFNGFTSTNDLGIKANEWYTVSFLAHSSGQIINCDFAGGGIDTNGINVNVTTANQYVSFTEQMPSNYDNANARFRLWTGNNGQGCLISNLKIERGMVATPWTDDIITTFNAANRVMPNSINNTMFGGDLYSSNWNGQTGAYGQGWLLQRGGTFYCNSVVARGSVYGGSFTEGYAWPTDPNGGGFHLSPSGLLLGNPTYNRYFQVSSDGNIYAPGFRLESSQLTLTNPIIVTPRINTTFSCVLPGVYITGQAQGATIQTAVGVNIYNGLGSYTYQWSLSVNGIPSSITLNSSPAADSAVITVTGQRAWVYGYLSVTIKDNATQMTTSASCYIQVQFGNAQQM